jgi:inorganic pyrophosphatase
MYKHIFLFFSLIFFALNVLSNPINVIDYKHHKSPYYNFFIEIPAGTNEKWEVNKTDGKLEVQKNKKGKRIINFISYPGNYGLIPQTIAGDGDPLDVIDLGPSAARGSTSPVKIIGGLYFKDKKKTDIKLIAINPRGNFQDIEKIDDLFYEHSSITEILKLWFLNYKKPGKMVFIRYLNKSESEDIIKKAHLKWRRNFKK